MPQRRDSGAPPEVMTWGKTAPALILAILFDLMRMFFNFFWFFGPALLGAYCVAKTGDVFLIGKVLAAGCAAAAGVAGFYTSTATVAFGTVMAMATGFAGWIAVGGWMMLTNARIFKENAVWFVASLAVSEVPFVNAIPALTGVTWRMYSRQIKMEKVAYKKYKEDQQAAELLERRQQEEQLMQAEQAQAEQRAVVTEEIEEGSEEKLEEPVHTPLVFSQQKLPEKENNAVNTSRRDFLRKTAVLVGGSAVNAYAEPLPLTALVGEKNSPSTQSYVQGIEALRKDALYEKNERMEIFVAKKNGTSSWVQVPASDVISRPNTISYSTGVIENAVADPNVVRVDVVHTHPLNTIVRDAGLVAQIQKEEASSPSMPPSLGDILVMALRDEEQYKENFYKLGQVVVDPVGVWRAKIENPEGLLFVKKLYERSKSQMNALLEREDVKKIIAASSAKGEHPGLMFIKLQEERSRLSKETNDLVEAVSKTFEEASKNKNYVDFMIKIELTEGGVHVLTDDKKLAEIRDLYKGIGINLTFTPHAEIKN